ncbi:MAG: ROK family protein [Verrucomicrobia bacterium]|nr:ROK family protein [Verrucomicrobiota bacterium]MDE3098559.1 ROK family protein [Verrucomicrobiota bacterium]
MSAKSHTRCIGVDLGGTSVRAGLVQNGRIIAIEKRPSFAAKGRQAVIDEICDTIQAVRQPGVRGIGIGVPSVVDKNGVVFSPANIPSWRRVPLKKILERRFRTPVFVNNDAKCFALGELAFGAGRGRKNLVGLIIGTGLGAGVIIDGRLFSGAHGAAGEIGHIPHGDADFEHVCSGRFFQREFGLDAAAIQKRADAGDRSAAEMLAAFGEPFAKVIMAVLYAYDPEIIVLGGGVSRAYPYFAPRLREKLKAFRFQDVVKKVRIVPSRKPHVAVLAAAALCLGAKSK